MNEQAASMMNQQQKMMNQPPPPMMSAPPPQLMNPQQSQPPQVIFSSALQSQMSYTNNNNNSNNINISATNQQKPHDQYQFGRMKTSGFSGSRGSTQNSQNFGSHSQMLMNPLQPQQPIMNRSYGMWAPPLQPMDHQLKFQNPNLTPMKTQGGGGGGFVSGSKQPSKHPLGPRNNWKGKKVGNKPDKRKDLGRRMENPMSVAGGGSSSGVGGILGGVPGNVGIGGGYQPPNLKDLQHQNRMKARKFFPKKYYNNYNNNNKNSHNMGKFAPRNTTSYIIRAKKSGGIADLVSPCPVTPAVLPTPIFSPSREVLVDMAKEEWGVDGYGSMKGLIRLRSPGHEGVEGHEDEEEDEGGSSESDVEEHLEVERRLDHDLSRFEMIYPNYTTVGGVEYNNVLENRVDDQDTHIAQLEEENLILKERLFLMERELGDLRRRLQCLERQSRGEDINEEVVENSSENDTESRGGAHSMEDNNEEMTEEHVEVEVDAKAKDENIQDGKEKACKNEENMVEIRGQEEKKDGIKVNDLKENEHSNNDLPVNVVEDNNCSAPMNTPAGDVCMVEVAHTGEVCVEEKQSKQGAAENEGLETSIDVGDLTDCPSLILDDVVFELIEELNWRKLQTASYIYADTGRESQFTNGHRTSLTPSIVTGKLFQVVASLTFFHYWYLNFLRIDVNSQASHKENVGWVCGEVGGTRRVDWGHQGEALLGNGKRLIENGSLYRDG